MTQDHQDPDKLKNHCKCFSFEEQPTENIYIISSNKKMTNLNNLATWD